jgi:hypothetical protein
LDVKELKKVKLISCENKAIYYVFSKVRVRNAEILYGDSRWVLRRMISKIRQPVLFWLDAHWDKELPLLGELDIIVRSNIIAVVLIDDFKVPGTNFRYDCYNGVPISDELIHPCLSGVKYVQLLPTNEHTVCGYTCIYLNVVPDFDKFILDNFRVINVGWNHGSP